MLVAFLTDSEDSDPHHSDMSQHFLLAQCLAQRSVEVSARASSGKISTVSFSQRKSFSLMERRTNYLKMNWNYRNCLS